MQLRSASLKKRLRQRLNPGIARAPRRTVFQVKKRRGRPLGRAEARAESRSALDGLERLTALQRRAFESLATVARTESERALPVLLARSLLLGFSAPRVQRCLAYLRDRARLLVHLNLTATAEALLRDTHYRSAWELNEARAEADRGWAEDLVFRGLYNEAASAERVKFGSLDLMNDPSGNRLCVPKFGASFLVLRRATVAARTTVTDNDLFLVRALGTLEHCAHVLLERSDAELRRILDIGDEGGAKHGRSQALAHFAELQFHGPLSLARDVEAIVLAPEDDCPTASCKSTRELALQLAKKLGCQIQFLDGTQRPHFPCAADDVRTLRPRFPK